MSRRYSSPKGPSQRQLRAGELVRHALVEIFHREDLRDPALHGLSITLTEVRMTPDLKQATVFSAPLGASIDRDKHPEIIKALNHAAPHLRHLLGQKIDMKFTPALIFRTDDSFAEARRIDELLASPKVARDLGRDEEG
ncbi:MAG: ribosome-binding factor A [Alphaproteobacteria bacterium RIFCSPHIGHO2_12_FULL_63_12]|nr:MAG: ribosome-binding factor A [Alphaproteobacteria bacterium RIFCSPHIGHO2_12_FULL_63_12]